MGTQITRTRRQVRTEARRRGYQAGGAAAATAAATALFGFMPLGLVGLGATGWLTWRWVRFRVRNGLRF